MLRRAPLKPKRETPRRNEGRVQNDRLKRRAVSMTADEARHMERIAAMGCLVCGRAANIHHVMRGPEKERRRDHRFIAPLCVEHHQGRYGVHGLGSEAAFAARYGIDLAEWSQGEWRRTHAEGL